MQEEEEEEIVDESVECEEEPIEEPAVQTEPIGPIETEEAQEAQEDKEDDRESIRAKRLQFLSRSQSHTEASSLCRVCFNPPSIHSFICT